MALRFAIASLGPLALLGWYLGSHMDATISRRSADVYATMTQAMFTMAGEAIVSPADLESGAPFSPERAKFIDGIIERATGRAPATQVRIVTPDLRVLYSIDRTEMGTRLRHAGPLDAAIAGTTTAKFVSFSANEPSRKLDKVEIYLPIRFDGSTAIRGAIVASAVDSKILSGIRRDVRHTQAVLLSGLALLWLTLLPISTSISRRLRRQAEENEQLAMHDTLTELPNRNMLSKRLDDAIRGADRDGSLVGLLLIDLDRFKEVNDTLGHGKGDEMLIHVANRLRRSTRPQDTVARLGGDEFAILVRGLLVSDELERIAARVTDDLADPFGLDTFEIAIQASIGGAMYPDQADDAEQLLQYADVAMYASKASGASYTVYSTGIDSHSASQLMLATELRRAVETDDELVVYFQPVASADTGRIMSMEALVRWQHPRRGFLLPLEFIPLAEQSGLVRPLTRRVLDLSLAQVVRWTDDGLDLSVCVNLSARDLRDASIIDDVRSSLQRHGIDAPRLELEVTETGILANPETAATIISELRHLGVRIALDDFGTGYSSLTYLKRLRPDRLKIDRSFVNAMADHATDAEIVRSVIDLAHSLHIGVTAEGVESEELWQLLDDLGCDLVQGNFLSEPLPARAATAWVAARHARLRLPTGKQMA